MNPVIAFDTETWLIEPGLLAPPLVCLQWLGQTEKAPSIVHRDNAYAVVAVMLHGQDTLVGHNVAYDMGVIAAQWPDLIPAIFAKYDRGQVTDTLIRDQLLQIAQGEFRGWFNPNTQESGAITYHLADLVRRHLGQNLKKEGFRLFYRAFDQVPNIGQWDAAAKAFQDECRAGRWPDWTRGLDDEDRAGLLAADPSEARTYALEDARTTLAVYEAQEAKKFGRWGEHKSSVYADQYRQTYAAFCLHLASAWGVHTDPDAVAKLAAGLQVDFDELQADLMAAGIVRAKGTVDTAAARSAMLEACNREDIQPALTPKGAVSLSADACDRVPDEDALIRRYSKYVALRKTLSNDVKMLLSARDTPLQPRYDMADTGRTRASRGFQAISKTGGIRECFVPRPGKVFAQGDYEALELHTLAQWCVSHGIPSKLAAALNAGKDVHTMMAATMLGITYEEGLARKKAKDPVLKDARQKAKPINFGFPGGLGIEKFVAFARAQYGVIMTEGEARQAKEAWLTLWPEMHEFFYRAAQATAGGELGTETHLFSGRIRGGCRYTALCNGRFQGLGADAAKRGLCLVTRACYADPESPLYGARPIGFFHDEIILEVDEGPTASPAAKELGRLMVAGANEFLPDVGSKVEPLLMSVWSKEAEPIYDSEGNLLVWSPKE